MNVEMILLERARNPLPSSIERKYDMMEVTVIKLQLSLLELRDDIKGKLKGVN